ncbi:MAG: gamma-glutamylcyclotransferase [Elsteraceae bacterium]
MTPFFAYGPLMHPDEMAVPCPDAEPVGPARLPGWRVAVGAQGRVTILPDLTGVVEGVLWAVEDDKLPDLLKAEPGYHHLELGVFDEEGQLFQAITSEAADPAPGKAIEGYLSALQEIARYWKLSEPYVAAIGACERR